MEQERLAALLRTKISEEMGTFRERMLKELPGEIYGSAYQIETKKKICGILMEMSQGMKEDELRMLLGLPELLAFLYSDWILSKFEDGGTDVLQVSIETSIKNLMKLSAVMTKEMMEEGAA